MGILTLSDVIRISKDKAATTKVKEVMTRNAVTVGPWETLLDALRKMTSHGVGRLPVIDDTGLLVGIITRTDLFRAYDLQVSKGLSDIDSFKEV